MGSLRLPLLVQGALGMEQALGMSLRLGPWLDWALLEKGLTLRNARQRLQELCPGEPELVRRLLEVAGGFEECDPTWLAAAWAELEPARSALLKCEIPVDLA